MQTLQKPKGVVEESRKSSTCQPGRVSIKYSDIVLLVVEPNPSFVTKLSPPLFTSVFVDKVLGTVGGLEFTGASNTGFLIDCCCCWDFESGTRSPPLLVTEEEDI